MNVTKIKAKKMTPALHFTIRFQRFRGRRSGFVSFFIALRPPVALESQWPAITTQPYCCDNECRGNYQSEPETRRAQVSQWRKLWDRMCLKCEGLWSKSQQPVPDHGGEMQTVECDLLEEGNREQR